MTPVRLATPVAAALSLVLLAAIALAGGAPPEPEMWADANEAYEKENWNEAIEKLDAFVAAYPESALVPRAHYQAARALHGLGRNDEAATRAEEALGKVKDPMRQGYAAKLHLLVAELQRRHYVRTAKAMYDHYEAAYRYYDLLLGAKPQAKERDELFDLLFDYAAAINEQADYQDVEEKIAAQEWKDWSARQDAYTKAAKERDEWRRLKTDALYRRAIELDGGKTHRSALALFHLACFYVNGRAQGLYGMSYYGVPEPAEPDTPEAKDEAAFIASVRRGLAIVEEIVSKHPGDELVPEALYLAAYTHYLYLQDLPAAVKAGERLIAAHPRHDRAAEARTVLAEIQAEEVAVQSPGTVLPDKAAVEVSLSARNVKEVELTLFRATLTHGRERDDRAVAEVSLRDVRERTELKRWKVETKIKDDHRGVSFPVPVDLVAPNVFILRAQAGAASAETLILVSNLALVSRHGEDRLVFFCADATTGEPRPGTSVDVRFNDHDGRGNRVHWFAKAAADASGLATIPIRGSQSGLGFEAIGKWQDGSGGKVTNHWALLSGYKPWSSADSSTTYYAIFDRPVYRPKQDVHWKVTVRQGAGGQGDLRYQTPAGRPLRVVITDPTGTEVYDETKETNENGAVSGDLTLGEKPPLGVWRATIWLDGQQLWSSDWQGSSFRVEEYKKPEYEVTVAAKGSRFRPGEPVEATVTARYYFGAPVADAEVFYRVERRQYHHWYWPWREFDWYYERPYRGWYGGEELIVESTAKTDAEGKVAVRFDAKKYEDGSDSEYSIEARVVDKSRREIIGNASVRVTADPFFCYLTPERWIVRPGERVHLSIRAEDPNGRGVATKGEYKVWVREVQGTDEKTGQPVYRDAPLLTDAAATKEDGTGTIEFIPDKEGLLHCVYTVRPEGGDRPVEASATVWSVPESYAGGSNRFANVDIVLDKESYRAGDTARCLVTSPFPGAHVLVTIEGASSIFEQRVLKVEGGAAALEIKLDKKHTPNVFVFALIVRDGRTYTQSRELLCPPADRFLTVAFEWPKPELRPGEKATVKVKTTRTEDGAPVPAELAIGICDASIYYIAPDVTTDIRKFYYGQKRYHNVAAGSGFDFRHGAENQAKPDIDGREKPPEALPDHCRPDHYRYHHEWRYRRYRNGDGVFAGREMAAGGADMPLAQEAAPSPSTAAPPPPGEPDARMAKKGEAIGNGDDGKPPGPEVKVRKDFPDALYWNAFFRTGPDGTGEIELTMPDTLTTWRATARAMTPRTEVGETRSDVITTKDLLIRLQAPRFFTERDECVLSGIVHNKGTKDEPEIKVSLALEGTAKLEAIAERAGEAAKLEHLVSVPAGKEVRIDWRTKVVSAGKAVVRMTAIGAAEADAMEMEFPVLPHGAEIFAGWSQSMVGTGRELAPDAASVLSLTLPAERAPGSAELRLVMSPSVAGVVLESLPYLIDYPYGCVEQTMSRFLPAVIARKALEDLRMDLQALVVPALYGTPHGKKLEAIDPRKLAEAIALGLDRLYGFQHYDGGWGWWQGGESDPYMSAYVLYGLTAAQRAGVDVRTDVLDSGYRFLLSTLVRAQELDKLEEIYAKQDRTELSFRSYVLASGLGNWPGAAEAEAEAVLGKLGDLLYRDRSEMRPYGKALLALMLFELGRRDEAKRVVENLADQAEKDAKAGTVSFGEPGAWYWRDDAVEATSFALRAFLALDPESKHIPGMVRWLVDHRRGSKWRSTKDTAIAVYGLTDYLRESGELDAAYTVAVTYESAAGKVEKQVRIDRASALLAETTIVVPEDMLAAGAAKLTIDKRGRGNLYWSAYLRYYTLEEGIKPAESGFSVKREYFRVHEDKVEVDREEWIGGEKKTRKVIEVRERLEPLGDNLTVKSGERLAVTLTIEATKPLEYLVFEDPKPAGCEPVDLVSGTPWGTVAENMELRDQWVAFFVSHLPKGKHEISYKLRAEVPGSFHTMPVRAYAMYAPDEVRASSSEARVAITEDAK